MIDSLHLYQFFDGIDPLIFDDWVDKLETACRISGRNIRESATRVDQ